MTKLVFRVFNQENADRTIPFAVFVSTAFVLALVLQLVGWFKIVELQSIDNRFEARQWLRWNSGTIARLNPVLILNHHESAGKDKSWNSTARWLTEDNHPPAATRMVIFTRLPEDQPSSAQAERNSWMLPLMSYPLERETMADLISFVAASGARAICLTTDYTGSAAGDEKLAGAIIDAGSGKLAFGRAVPVFLSNSKRVATAGNTITVAAPAGSNGVIEKLRQIDPSAQTKKHLGLNGIILDEDNRVRRMALELNAEQSLGLRVFESLNDPLSRTPAAIDIDFITPPQSNAYPVKPLSYLIDPQMRRQITQDTSDVSLKDAVVFLSDGIADSYYTPLTENGGIKRTGAEILAQSVDTLARRSWLQRMGPLEESIAIAVMILVSAINFLIWRHISRDFSNRLPEDRRHWFIFGSYAVFLVFAGLSIYIIAVILFAGAELIVPFVVPTIAVVLATLLTLLWERNQIEMSSVFEALRSSQETLAFAQEKHEAELIYQASLAERKAMEEDRRRRVDVVRRLNHDLKAPISVFNWTLAKLLKERKPDDPMFPIFERLKKSSDHLSLLLSEIVVSLSEDIDQRSSRETEQACDIITVLKKQCEIEKAVATIRRSEVVLTLPSFDQSGANNEEKPLGPMTIWVVGSELEIARIIANIVGNALTHNSSGTRVDVKLKVGDWSDNTVVVSVTDNGKGIAQDDLDKIFQVGYRAGGVDREGEGLGLSIASTLVAKIGGKISVESTVGEGTRFDISFQQYQAPAKDEKNQGRAEPVKERSGSSRNV